jgi:hypothetical protein
MSAQNQDKMKTKLNIALEGTCNRRRCGRFIILDRGNLQALFVLKGGYMEALQSLPKRLERPPVYLISEGGKIIENPSSTQIADELEMTVMAPIRVIYELFMGNPDDELMSNPKSVGGVANTLYSTLERWRQLSKYL